MQPIPYTEEEFLSNVSRKLAVLRKGRATAGPGASFEERLAKANREIALQDKPSLQRVIGGTKSQGGTVNGRIVDWTSLDRVVDDINDSVGAPAGSNGSNYGAEDDAYGHSEPGRGRDAEGSPDEPGAPSDDDETKAEVASQLRLLQVNQRQTSEDWVILDRATALAQLLDKPKGLTLVQLAEALLGKRASPRDTRRLSAMMKREEIRETITRAGRGMPIFLTEEGRREVLGMDLEAERRKSIEDRQRRVLTQQSRLARAFGVDATPSAPAAESAPKAPEKAKAPNAAAKAGKSTKTPRK